MPPEGFYAVLDRGKLLFQIVEQHSVSPLIRGMDPRASYEDDTTSRSIEYLHGSAGIFSGADYTTMTKKNNVGGEQSDAPETLKLKMLSCMMAP